MGESKHQPFSAFGRRLKTLREKAQESLDEVCGAVEIDKDQLARIENGEIRPSEDVLILLLNHFNTSEKVSDSLWDLAGYPKRDTAETYPVEDQQQQVQTIMLQPMDARIVYTDMVHIMINNYGVVMNFMQSSGQQNQPLAVARIGMSKEHAQSVLDVLTKTLAQAEAQEQTPKRLEEPKDKKSSEK